MLFFSRVLFFSLLLVSVQAHSYQKGEELLWACQADINTPEGAVKKTHCSGYLSGILDGLQLMFGIKPETQFFCPPESGIRGDQQVRIVIKYLESKPENLHKSARMSVVLAYMEAFPCK